jgi:hypothetical protein
VGAPGPTGVDPGIKICGRLQNLMSEQLPYELISARVRIEREAARWRNWCGVSFTPRCLSGTILLRGRISAITSARSPLARIRRAGRDPSAENDTLVDVYTLNTAPCGMRRPYVNRGVFFLALGFILQLIADLIS